MKSTFFGTLPVQATEIAARHDDLYVFLVLISIVFFAIVMGAMLYFTLKYRKGLGHKTKPVAHNLKLEIIWTAVPLVLLLVIFAWGWIVYRQMIHAPGDALVVRVQAQKWKWTFQYENGLTQDHHLVVPVNRPVKLLMSSYDVLHSFFVPAFRIKSDVVPRMYTSVWFEPKILGQHQVFCTEYCGGNPVIGQNGVLQPYGNHSTMYAMVHVVKQEEFDSFLRGKPLALKPAPYEERARLNPPLKTSRLQPLADQGFQIAQAQGCVSCHTSDGKSAPGGGPTWKGIWGSNRPLMTGETVRVDENYLRESILQSQKKVVKGFERVTMPPYQGVLDEMQVNALVEYIKTL
jgi:cytochrome c oxidase subunit 2